MKRSMPKLLSLFLSFLKIGAFTFGGGYGMIALLEHEFVSRKNWLKKEEFLDILAVAESTPGPIAVNTATYIGYRTCGVLGSLLATLAVCLPAFTIIFVISLFFDQFLSLTYVGYAFRGVQVAVVYLIASAGIKVVKGLKRNAFSVVIAVLVFAAFVTLSLLTVSFSSVFYILIAGVLGLMLYGIGEIRRRKDGKGELLLDSKASVAGGEITQEENESALSDGESAESTTLESEEAAPTDEGETPEEGGKEI